jgi:hypothetical protein
MKNPGAVTTPAKDVEYVSVPYEVKVPEYHSVQVPVMVEPIPVKYIINEETTERKVELP